MKNRTIAGIEYSMPEVTLLHASPLALGEVAARTAYDSFHASEHQMVQEFPETQTLGGDIEGSELLTSLAWVYHHHSVLEMCNLTYSIKGTSRGVLQEHSRQRIQSLTVRSTRYTMGPVLHAFVASLHATQPEEMFITLMLELDIFVTTDTGYNTMQISDIFNKLLYQRTKLGYDAFMKIAVSKSSLQYLEGSPVAAALFDLLQNGKQRRNVGDNFKSIVNDNWKVDMIVTFNLRSLKNYFGLRDSGASYEQIRWLAQGMQEATPKKYLDLIVRSS